MKLCIRYTLLLSFVMLIAVTKTAFAQTQVPPTKKADDLFRFKNYNDALTEYTTLFKANPTDDYLSFQIALCYLNMNEDRSIAVSFLEPLAAKPKAKPAVFFYLGKALMYANKFKDAMANFQKAKEAGVIDGVDNAAFEREIRCCENAINFAAKPIKVKFENLGSNINTQFADYSPYISSNESFLIFNSSNDKDGIKRANGNYTSDVYISEVFEGEWQKAKNLGEVVNTKGKDEEIVGVSSDGNTLLFNFEVGDEGAGDLFIGPKYENEIMKPIRLSNAINSLNFENSAVISPDGKMLYYSSNKAGGYGGFDLYRSIVLPDGNWSEGMNLGSDINTQFDDDFPNMSMDGNSIYFSSKGHNSMGGFDIFKINMDTLGKWSKPENLGYPLNDAYDNMSLCMSGKGRYGYVAAIRPEGFGDKDIYRVTFGNVQEELTVLKGMISSVDKTKALEDPAIIVTNAETGYEVGEYAPTKLNRYCIILPPGKYKITASAKNHDDFSEYIDILGKSSFINSIDKDIILKTK